MDSRGTCTFFSPENPLPTQTGYMICSTEGSHVTCSSDSQGILTNFFTRQNVVHCKKCVPFSVPDSQRFSVNGSVVCASLMISFH